MLALPLVFNIISCVQIVFGQYGPDGNYCANFNKLLLSNKPRGVAIDKSWQSKLDFEKFTQLSQAPLMESQYENDPQLFEMVKIAYEAIGEKPSERGANYAEAFAQYMEFIKPRGSYACMDDAFTDAQAFFFYMVGDASSDEEKKTFAALAAVDVETSRYLDRPMARFDTDVASLEAFLWLQTFERVNPPFDAVGVSPVKRMEEVAWRSFNEPFASLDEYKVFNYKYEQAHGTNSIFRPIPDFAVLNFDYTKTLVEVLQMEADKLTSKAQGKCVRFLREILDEELLQKAAVCSVQTEPRPEWEGEVAFGKQIAQEYRGYVISSFLATTTGDTRTDEQKFLAFTRDLSARAMQGDMLEIAYDRYVDAI